VQCENGGQCLDLFGGFFCLCPVGFHGPNCQNRHVSETPSSTPQVIVVNGPDHTTSMSSDHSEQHSGRHRFMLVMFFLIAGFAAVGIVAYRQRTDVLSRASLDDGSGGKSMHGSVYENSIYGGMSASVGDGIQGGSARHPAASVLDKAKELASKAGARGVLVGSAAPSGGSSIYDVSASDGL